MRILILEDSQNRIEAFTKKLQLHEIKITKVPIECIELLKNERWDCLFLDHDMGIIFNTSGKGTGYEVAEFLSNNTKFAPRQIIVHTQNPVGGDNIMRCLTRAGIKAKRIPNAWEIL